MSILHMAYWLCIGAWEVRIFFFGAKRSENWEVSIEEDGVELTLAKDKGHLGLDLATGLLESIISTLTFLNGRKSIIIKICKCAAQGMSSCRFHVSLSLCSCTLLTAANSCFFLMNFGNLWGSWSISNWLYITCLSLRKQQGDFSPEETNC